MTMKKFSRDETVYVYRDENGTLRISLSPAPGARAFAGVRSVDFDIERGSAGGQGGPVGAGWQVGTLVVGDGGAAGVWGDRIEGGAGGGLPASKGNGGGHS